MKISQILTTPIKKEYKAPFSSSALVFNDVIGFCFSDFCKNVYIKYKHNDKTQYTPEYIFSKMITLRSMKSHKHNARKLAIDLIFLMNCSYRPWYINDIHDEFVSKFIALGIDVYNTQSFKLQNDVITELEHPYIAIAFALFSDNDSSEFDAETFAKSLCQVIDNHSIYKYCRDYDLFSHDTVLLSLYEIIHKKLKSSKNNFALNQLTSTIYRAVELKSQTLLMFSHFFSYSQEKKKIYAMEFLNSLNFAKYYDYSASMYENIVSEAISDADWNLVDEFLPRLGKEVGLDNLRFIELQEKLSLKQEKERTPCSQTNKMESKEKFEHHFSPYLTQKTDLDCVQTKDLFGLIALLKVLDEESGMFLRSEKLKYIYPSEEAVFSLLYDLITNHVITIEKAFFDSIPVNKINFWESYINAPFDININGCIGNKKTILSILYETIECRGDLVSVCFDVWKLLSYSYFYSSYKYYSQNITDEWIQKYEIPEDFIQNIYDADLSCKKYSYIAYSAVKNAVSFHHMGESNGDKHTCNMMTYYLNKYLDFAKTSPQDYSKPRMEIAPVFQVERLMNYFVEVNYDDIYNLTPNLEFLITPYDN